VHSLCEDRAPELDAAVDAGDTAALSALASELRDMQSAVETALRAARPPAHVRRWLQGSVFALYDLLSLCADQLPQAPPPQRRGAGGGGRGRGGGRGGGRKSASAGAGGGVAVDTESLATCARIVAVVAPGSAAHVDLAIELLVRCDEVVWVGGEQGQCGPGAVQYIFSCLYSHCRGCMHSGFSKMGAGFRSAVRVQTGAPIQLCAQ
jgi:hypothetical protein